jgi:predicted PurR-regulated permease PerM
MTRSWRTSTRIIVAVISLLLIILFIYRAQPLIGPLIFAGLLAYILNLIVRFLKNRTRLTRKWAVNIVYFVFIAFLIATPGTLVPLAVSQAEELSTELQELASQVESLLTTPIVILGRTIQLSDLWSELTRVFTDFNVGVDSAITVLETTTTGLLRIVIVIVVTYYLMMDWQGLERWLVNLLPENGMGDQISSV